jgi:hypothetical protein
MVAEGHSNKIIAEVLSISSWTVCTHLRRIFAKLGVGSRAAMVARLLERLSAYLTPHLAIPRKPRLRAVEKASSIKSLKQQRRCRFADGLHDWVF